MLRVERIHYGSKDCEENLAAIRVTAWPPELGGLPGRPQYRHLVTAPSLFDAYGGSAFPAVLYSD